METRVIKVTSQEVETEDFYLREPARALASGNVVAFPTETVYGLGTNALDETAVRKIFELKGRPSDNPLIVHLHSKSVIHNYVEIVNEVEKMIIEDLMPGPLTLILKKKDIIPAIVSAGLPTVGIRIPYNIIARKLIELARVPVAAPSANISGKPSATEAQTVIEEFAGKIPFIIDGGKTHIGIESTVVLVKEDKDKYSILILRPGFVTKEDLEDFVNDNSFSKPVEVVYSEELSQSNPLSPGQKYKHYSPKSHVVIVKDLKRSENLVREFKNEKIGILGRKKFLNDAKKFLTYLGVKNILELEWCEYDLVDCARNLFFAYRIFDKENVALILVEYLEEKGLGYSIMNRVKKSSTYFF